MRILFLWLLILVSSGCIAGSAPMALAKKISSPHAGITPGTLVDDVPYFADAVADISHVHPIKIFKHTRQQPGTKSYHSVIIIRTAFQRGSTEAARYAAADYIPIQLLLLFPKHNFW